MTDRWVETRILAEAPVLSLPAVPTWRRRLRRVRTRPLSDPLGQGLLTLLTAIATGLTAVWLFLVNQPAYATPVLLLAAVLTSLYVALAVRAFKRDKAVQYWQDRQRLELDLAREQAHRAVLTTTLNQIQRFEHGHGEALQTHEALDEIASNLYRALTARHDDVAVVIALQTRRRCRILRSALSPGSRWRDLQAGKECRLESTFERKLSELARYHRAFEVPTEAGRLRVAILYDSPLSKPEVDLLKQLPGYFEMIAHRWRVAPPPEYGQLQSAG